MCKICTLLFCGSSPSANTLPMCLVMTERSRSNNAAICSWLSHTVSPSVSTSSRSVPPSVW